MKKLIMAALATSLCSVTLTVAAFENQPAKIIKHITVVNESNIPLFPTVEGVSEGCVGGSIPPILHPISPHTSREVNIVFIQYLMSCRFTVLPVPNILTLLQGCRHVKENDTVIFTGKDVNVRCEVS